MIADERKPCSSGKQSAEEWGSEHRRGLKMPVFFGQSKETNAATFGLRRESLTAWGFFQKNLNFFTGLFDRGMGKELP
jgi:hypothetical protein